MESANEKQPGSLEDVGKKLTQDHEAKRIKPDGNFSKLYVDYDRDMSRVDSIAQTFNKGNGEKNSGDVAEALVLDSILDQKISQHFQFRPTSRYDDYFHGADIVVEPKNTNIQAVSAIDITINQEDIKGSQRQSSSASESRPIGLEEKLKRTKRYTDFIAEYDASRARKLLSWIDGGGLHEKRNPFNQGLFDEAERLFLLKYYKAPDTAKDPEKPGYIIGGPQTVISIDSMFVNKALQNHVGARQLISDIAMFEFASCIQMEQAYLNQTVLRNKSRNIFFDSHFAKVNAWGHVFERPEIAQEIGGIVGRIQKNKDAVLQAGYYTSVLKKIYK